MSSLKQMYKWSTERFGQALRFMHAMSFVEEIKPGQSGPDKILQKEKDCVLQCAKRPGTVSGIPSHSHHLQSYDQKGLQADLVPLRDHVCSAHRHKSLCSELLLSCFVLVSFLLLIERSNRISKDRDASL